MLHLRQHVTQWDFIAFSCTHLYIFTFADHTSILIVITVVRSNPSVAALAELWFAACACDVIQPDGPAALSKACTLWCWEGPATAQLSTHHLSIDQVPDIVTNRPPLSTEEDLYSARAGAVSSIGQTDLPLNCCAVACCCCGSFHLICGEVLRWWMRCGW